MCIYKTKAERRMRRRGGENDEISLRDKTVIHKAGSDDGTEKEDKSKQSYVMDKNGIQCHSVKFCHKILML